ncbi:MAG: OmpH family outer membrane protein [Nitrospirae bacterium]|nr:MAG: OmpH family outer membrane protein [Nitrospirota bacterium]
MRLSTRQPSIRLYRPFVMIVFAIGALIGSEGTLSCLFAKDTFKVAVLDPQAVIENSKAGRRALETLKKHAEAREKLLKSDQEELKELQEEIQNADPQTPKDVLTRKQELFAKKFQEFQKRGQEFQQELNEKQRELVKEYMEKIEKATEAVAKRHGFSLVIDKGSDTTLKIVLYHRKGLDITNEVIQEFNRLYK